MAYINVDLSELVLPAGGIGSSITDEIIHRLLDLSFGELDAWYGTNDWCSNPKVLVFPGPYPNIRIQLLLSDNYNDDELSAHVNCTFKKHWDTLIKEIYGMN